MKPLVVGAVLAMLWLVFGPRTMSVTVADPLLQPVVVAFAAGLYARPHLTGRRQTR